MDDFSPWDIADIFRLHEAACLIAGVMPLSKRFPDADEIPAAVKPVLKKLSVGYYFGTMLDASEAIDSPQNPKERWLFGIAADPSDVNLVWKHPRGALRKGGTTLDMGATILSYLKHAMVSRSELHRWVKAMGIKSAYSFAPVAAAPEQGTVPAQTAPLSGALVGLPKQRAQEVRILELLRDNGYDPLKLAQRKPGKPGPKAEIRTLVLTLPALFTQSSFEKAWERLRNDGSVAGAE